MPNLHDPTDTSICPYCSLPLDKVFDLDCVQHADERFRAHSGLSPLRGLIVALLLTMATVVAIGILVITVIVL